MRRGGPLRRTGRIRPVSARRARENRERAALFPGQRGDSQDRPLCVVYELAQVHTGIVPAKVLARCGRWADDGHEILSRARRGSITDPANVIPPCRWCHNAITPGPPWAIQLGLVKHSWPASEETPDVA